MPDYIGAATPTQAVRIRQGRFTRYSSDNPGFTGPRTNPSGAGHQLWNESEFPCGARVGTSEGPHANANYNYPWQALWLPVSAYVDVPNVVSVKLDKKLEIGGVGTATIELENIGYPAITGGQHVRERGFMSPLRGYVAPGREPLLGEWGEVVPLNEWQGRFAYVSQITVYQGYGTEAKTFTGLVEEVDTTSHPDRIIITARDFGQVFTDEHFFDWAIDPLIKKTVIFVDEQEANFKKKVGYNALSSDEDLPLHPAKAVLRLDPSLAANGSWQTNTVHSDEQTEYVEIALPEGAYAFADVHVQWGGMEAYFSLRAANKEGGGAPVRQGGSSGPIGEPMTIADEWLDKDGWVKPTKGPESEEQKVPGVNGGNTFIRKYESYPFGPQRTPLDPSYPEEFASPVLFHVGKNSVLRISFRKLHKVEAGENFRAGVQEFHGLLERLEEAGALPGSEWVSVEDISDIIRIICQWAGFKEWDIEDTGTRLPARIVTDPTKAYMDIIKQVAEGIDFTFFMADPTPDSPGSPLEGLGGSLGVPTFRRTQVVLTEAERAEKEAIYSARTARNWTGAKVQPLPLPVITDRDLLTAVNLKQSSESLDYTIRVFGTTMSSPGDPAASVPSGKRLEYTFRPPWAGNPASKYADSRLAGVLKLTIHTDPLYATEELARNAAWFIALQEALASIEATIELPALPGIDLDDHVVLLDLGTGLTTRLAIQDRTSTFTEGEARKFTMQLTGPLLDTPDIVDMLAIIHGTREGNGEGGEWASPNVHFEGSGLGYG